SRWFGKFILAAYSHHHKPGLTTALPHSIQMTEQRFCEKTVGHKNTSNSRIKGYTLMRVNQGSWFILDPA
ncbi:uncharacterized protein METZ01_LOCUS380868, partial [marine metagenome]